MMKIIYDLFFLIFSFIHIPYLLVKGKFHRDFLQKFGFLPKELVCLKKPVWIHAVSVGEAALAAKLAGEIKNRYRHIPVIVSTTTQTGNKMIRKLEKNMVDGVFYYPLDLSVVVSRVVRLIRPRLYVMIETELWPNLLEELQSRKVPVVLANGRISDASFRNYRKIRVITNRILGCIDSFCMQSRTDAERIQYLGASSAKVIVTGNMKFDEKTEIPTKKVFTRTDLGFNKDDEIIIAGSTHSPEEQIVVDIFKELRAEHRALKLILAPRHVDRADGVENYIKKRGLTSFRLSDVLRDNNVGLDRMEVLLVDTIGHLKDIYNTASIIFVGGSLVKKGGQNPIEGARWSKVVVFGPYMFNFREVTDIFLENNAAIRVKDALHLKSQIRTLLQDNKDRMWIAENAGKVIAKNAGAIKRTMKQIEEYLKK